MFADIATKAGFLPGPDGKLDLPPTDATAQVLGGAALALLPEWEPGMDAQDVTLTGPGPVWAYLAVAHALHGRVRVLTYAAPNAPNPITIYSHGGH